MYFARRLRLCLGSRTFTGVVNESLLKKALALGAQRGASVRSPLAEELKKVVERENAYGEADRGP